MWESKCDFFSTHSPCWQRRKLLDTSYSTVHLETMASPNSMSERKCWGHLQATQGLGYSHSSFPAGSELIFVLPHLQGRFYLAFVWTRLGMTLVPFWGCLLSPGVMLWTIILLGMKILVPQDLVKSILSSSLILGVMQTQGIQIGPQTTWYVGSLGSSEVSYEGSHTLSVFLHNTSLHITQ